MLAISPWLRTYVRDMFGIVRLFAPVATEIARSGSSGSDPLRKVRRIRDIVNFMNFTSGRILPTRAGTGV
jgi:hypothetical protein